MSTLVATFESRLQVSHEEALWRVIGFAVAVSVAIATVITALVLFPWKELTQTIALLPGQYTEVSQILDGEVLVERRLFLEMSVAGRPMFIAPGDKTISYMVKVDGISYRYDQSANFDWHRYGLSRQAIQENVLVREFHRSISVIVVSFIALPLIILMLCFIGAIKMQWKNYGTYYNPQYRHVWTSHVWTS